MRMRKFLALSLALCLVLGMMAGCDNSQSDSTGSTGTPDNQIEAVDYVSQLKLDKNSSTAKLEATVKTFVDGDTVHFNVDSSVMPNGLLKARFLAIDTPESTGKIEEYGKAASNFTKEKLKNAVSIIIESDNETWNADSTGSRYMVWVWYKATADGEYRNLNVEILQNGLAIASNTGSNIYGDTALMALAQAKAQKLNVFSGVKDPDFYYGEAVELDLKELRQNTEAYNGMKVAFNGIVSVNNNNGVYVEAYDSETDRYHGIYVYYGFNLSGDGLRILEVGNEVRIVGTVSYYENGGTWQVSGLTYRAMKPNDPGNIQKLSDGHSAAYVPMEPSRLTSEMVDIIVNDEISSVRYAAMAMNTSVQMSGLVVKDVYTTDNDESSSKGAMTLTCEVNGVTVTVRTVVLYDADGKLVTAEAYEGKTIDVKGVVDYFDGDYQIKVFATKDITVH